MVYILILFTYWFSGSNGRKLKQYLFSKGVTKSSCPANPFFEFGSVFLYKESPSYTMFSYTVNLYIRGVEREPESKASKK